MNLVEILHVIHNDESLRENTFHHFSTLLTDSTTTTTKSIND